MYLDLDKPELVCLGLAALAVAARVIAGTIFQIAIPVTNH